MSDVPEAVSEAEQPPFVEDSSQIEEPEKVEGDVEVEIQDLSQEESAYLCFGQIKEDHPECVGCDVRQECLKKANV